MKFRLVALMLLGLGLGAAQTTVKSKKPRQQQSTAIPTSLKAAAIDVYVGLDDFVMAFDPLTLKAKADRLKAELLLAEDGAATSGEPETDTKARFGDYELATTILPILMAGRQGFDLLLLQSDSCKRFEDYPKMWDDCQLRMNAILDDLIKTHSQVKSALDRTRNPANPDQSCR